MKKSQVFVFKEVFMIATMLPACAMAQTFPSKPLRIITGGAGGGNDVVARLIAQGMTASLGQQVVVDNRPSGVIPGEVVSRSPPDGYTLLVSGSSFWILPLFQPSPYDVQKDFSPITLAVTTPNILAVHRSLPADNVVQLIALARARPGQLNYGTSGAGSSPHLGGELFKALAKVDIVRINYKSAGQALSELIAGQVQITFGNALSVAPQVTSGRLKALAVTGARRSALFAELPTVAESGLLGYELISPFVILGPAKMPAAIVTRLNQEILQLLNKPESKERLRSAGIEVVGSPPEPLAAMLQAEIFRWGKVLKGAQLSVQ
jgi:tripartite-type tricarboxylate transporter receptor subunit TctC